VTEYQQLSEALASADNKLADAKSQWNETQTYESWKQYREAFEALARVVMMCDGYQLETTTTEGEAQ
jgi:hypothetical protein